MRYEVSIKFNNTPSEEEKIRAFLTFLSKCLQETTKFDLSVNDTLIKKHLPQLNVNEPLLIVFNDNYLNLRIPVSFDTDNIEVALLYLRKMFEIFNISKSLHQIEIKDYDKISYKTNIRSDKIHNIVYYELNYPKFHSACNDKGLREIYKSEFWIEDGKDLSVEKIVEKFSSDEDYKYFKTEFFEF